MCSVPELYLFFYGEDDQGNSMILDQIYCFNSTVNVPLFGVLGQSGYTWWSWWVPFLVILEKNFEREIVIVTRNVDSIITSNIHKT